MYLCSNYFVKILQKVQRIQKFKTLFWFKKTNKVYCPKKVCARWPKFKWGNLKDYHQIIKFNYPWHNYDLKKLQIDPVLSHISTRLENISSKISLLRSNQSIQKCIIWKKGKRMIQIEKLLKKQIDKNVSNQHHQLFSHSTFA